MNIKSLLLLFAFVLLLPFAASAVDEEKPSIYVIKQGDTLWGLSERFIKDPNYWPQMWAKNSQITNPHFIYPGQKVRVFPDRLEFVPKELPVSQTATQKAAAKATEDLPSVATEKTYLVSGNEGFLLEESISPDGTIILINHKREIAGTDDIVYTDLGSSIGAKSGDKFSIYRKDVPVKHPVTGSLLGTKIIPLGTLQLTDIESNSSRAIITSNTREVTPNAYLMKPRQGGSQEVVLKEAASNLKGYIVESFHGTSMISAGDVVYIDLGTNQGAVAGNMLYVVRDVKLEEKFFQKSAINLPQELIGAIVILETGKNTSTAIVVKSVDTIYKGDVIVSPAH